MDIDQLIHLSGCYVIILLNLRTRLFSGVKWLMKLNVSLSVL